MGLFEREIPNRDRACSSLFIFFPSSKRLVITLFNRFRPCPLIEIELLGLQGLRVALRQREVKKYTERETERDCVGLITLIKYIKYL